MRERTVLLADAYGWTFDEVRAQPASFIVELEQFRSIKAQLASRGGK